MTLMTISPAEVNRVLAVLDERLDLSSVRMKLADTEEARGSATPSWTSWRASTASSSPCTCCTRTPTSSRASWSMRCGTVTSWTRPPIASTAMRSSAASSTTSRTSGCATRPTPRRCTTPTPRPSTATARSSALALLVAPPSRHEVTARPSAPIPNRRCCDSRPGMAGGSKTASVNARREIRQTPRRPVSRLRTRPRLRDEGSWECVVRGRAWSDSLQGCTRA